LLFIPTCWPMAEALLSPIKGRTLTHSELSWAAQHSVHRSPHRYQSRTVREVVALTFSMQRRRAAPTAACCCYASSRTVCSASGRTWLR
jgi:hypothetical protein